MTAAACEMHLDQIHIEVARNATDDFNPFHDKNRWRNITANPFPGPIALGFQLECLIEQQIRLYREEQSELEIIERENLNFSNYQFKFVNAVSAGQEISVSIKDSRLREGDNPVLANRVMLKADDKLAVAGYKRESRLPLVSSDLDLSKLRDLREEPDRSFVASGEFFLKRKYMTTSNAKNFMSSALVEQADYIDELDDKVRFPEIFPCSLISCALLERAMQQGHDFEKQPLVYASHNISIDRRVLARLRSNDTLHLLSRHTDPSENDYSYKCFGVAGSEHILFQADIDLMPLA